MQLTIEKPVELARAAQIKVLERAIELRPSLDMRARLAELLFAEDRFDEAIAFFEDLVAERPNARLYALLGDAHLARETPVDDERALDWARTGAALATDSYAHATLLAVEGKALRRLGRPDDARAALVRALAFAPDHVNAFKRLATIDLERGRADLVLAETDRLLALGVAHARLFASRAMALAALGRIGPARTETGLDSLVHQETLIPPDGWPDLASFNDQLGSELLSHPDLRYDRYGSASHATWRVDAPARPKAPAVLALQRAILDRVQAYAARTDPSNASWSRFRPDAAQLHNWAVITHAEGFEEWHAHQNGWLSGVYYVEVPASVDAGVGRGGCIVFGMPDHHVGPEAAQAVGELVVRPRAGLLMMFPSHLFHRTFPHGIDARRICIAFDLQPI